MNDPYIFLSRHGFFRAEQKPSSIQCNDHQLNNGIKSNNVRQSIVAEMSLK